MVHPRVVSDESGALNVIEVVIAALVMVIVLSSAVLVVGTVSRVTTNGRQLAVSSTSAQVNLNEVSDLISTTTTPESAYLASSLSSASYACWGWATSGASHDPNGASSTPASSASSLGSYAPTVGILVAHDFEYEFCGFRAGSSVPRVYDIYLDYSTCTDVGYCSLKVIDYGQYGDSPGAVAYLVPDVYCDTACQTELSGGAVSSAPMFTYYRDAISSGALGTGDTSSNSSILSGIGTVQVNLTVLSRTTNKNLAISSTNPGTTLVDQIRLPGVGG